MTEKTGTREWSESSVNICRGCAHGCLYCYGRDQALRFGRIKTGADWTTEIINQKAVDKRYGKRKGMVMFPTTHDITAKTVGACVQVLRKLLKAGNRVLIVSKPDPKIFAEVRGELEPWKSQVLFRFSIGSWDPAVAELWEPGAPGVDKRRDALRAAFRTGWQTSVSMEPLLEPWFVGNMIRAVEPFVTDTIWIGKLNKMTRRCEWTAPMLMTLAATECARLEQWQSDGHVLDIYKAHKDNPLIRWKDSYKAVLRKYGIEVAHA